MRLNSRNTGMTIIEMMIVCVIIGILASIAILTLAHTRKHAVATEAIVGLSSLKQAMRHYYAEYGHYQDLSDYLDSSSEERIQATYPQGINPGFVTGTYFLDQCYKIVSTSAGGYIYCYPERSANLYGKGIADGAGAYIALDLDGTFSQHNVSCTGYKSE